MGFDVSSASFTDSFDVSGQDDSPEGVAFNGDGSKMFVVAGGNDNVYEYSISSSSTGGASDYNKEKKLDVKSVSGSPTVSKAQPIVVTDGDDSTSGTGDIIIDATNVSSTSDIAVLDQNDNTLDFEFENPGAIGNGTLSEPLVIWVYNDWVRDGTTQAKVVYGNGPSSSEEDVTGTWNHSGQNFLFVQHLNENNLPSDTALDSSPANNDGTVSGASLISGRFDGGASFDGSDDFIEIGDVGVGFDSDKTVAAFLFFETNSGIISDGSNHRVLDTNDPGFSRTALSKDGNNDFRIEGGDGSSQVYNATIDATQFSKGEWIYVVGRVNDSAGNVEITAFSPSTGKVSSSSSFSFSVESGNNVFIGREDSSRNHFEGRLDEVKVSNDVKSDSYLQAAFDASPGGGQTFFSQQSASSTTTSISATVTDSLSFNDATASLLSFTASDSLNVTENTAGTLADALSDSLQLSEQVLGELQAALSDQLDLTENTATALVSQVSDQLSFSETTLTGLTLQVLASDNLQFAEATQSEIIDRVTDQLSFAEATQSALAQSTSDQITFQEAVSSAFLDTLTDQVDFREAFSTQGTAILRLVDRIGFSEVTRAEIQDLQSDQLQFNEAAESRLEQVLDDSLGFSSQFKASLASTLSDDLGFSESVSQTVAATLTDNLSFAERVSAAALLDLELKSPTKALMTNKDRFAVMESHTFKQGDLGDSLKATLQDDNGSIDLANAQEVRLVANNRSGDNVLNEVVTLSNAAGGEIEYQWDTGDFIETAGIYRIEFEVEDATGRVETVPNDGFVTVEIEEELAE